MEQEKIKELLSRYYEGLTTEEEEKVLREYLDQTDVSPDLSAERGIFSLAEEEVPEPSEEFVKKLAAIGSGKTESKRHLRIGGYSLSAAAGLALLVASYVLFMDQRSGLMNDTFSDPELAMAEVKSILCTVSKNMKTGTEPLNAFNTIGVAGRSLNELGKINSAVDKSLGNLRYLNMLEAVSQQNENNK